MGAAHRGLGKAQTILWIGPVGSSVDANPIAQVELEDASVPGRPVVKFAHRVSVKVEIVVGVAAEERAQEAVEVFPRDGSPFVASALYALVVVQLGEGLDVIHPPLDPLAVGPTCGGPGQSQRQLRFDVADEAFGEKGLVSAAEKVPTYAVVAKELLAKAGALSDGIAVGIDDGHLAGEFNEACDGVEPLLGALAPGGQHPQTVADVFDGHEEAGGAVVRAGPRLVEFAVVDEENSGSQRRNGLVARHGFRPGKRTQLLVRGLAEKGVDVGGFHSTLCRLGPGQKLAAVEGYARF